MVRTDEVQSKDIKWALYRKAAVQGIPLSGTFELTPACNFNCRMCYVHLSPEQIRADGSPMMELDDWLKLAEQMKESGTLYLLLTGGEPLLWPHFWELYDALYRMGFLLSINTNGSMITDEIIKRFVEQPPYRINITLYGACDQTYERLCRVRGMYDHVIHAVEGLQNAGVLVRLNCSLTPDNVSDLMQILEYADERGLTMVPVAYMFPPLRRDASMIGQNRRFTPQEAAEVRMQILRFKLSAEGYRKLLAQGFSGIAVPSGLDEECVDSADGKVRCMAGRASFWVTWNGYMTMCGMIPDERLCVREMSFQNAWQAIREISQNIRLSGTCSKCESKEICHSCAAMAAAETGTVSGIPKYLCEMVQEMKKIAERELSEGCKQ